ncbi:electron transport complex subunit RsxC [Pseudoteredinibacter isoporae]|uniref:electron transport complex subunit RsxC n=1 Tax=Pseudoteredinibacter isoporae TaxID=570281 RepID=UPI0014201B89|nr:electron transport complex subunit RsxC [Pseudoteredinibacter isoporae]NIB24055.1 electron transport complex subunit RsxC [Pseudoteredinibacter isoporae]
MSQLIYPLRGGVHPPENKAQSLQIELQHSAIPEELVLPLGQHIGAPAEAIVEVGDKVLRGQMIAEPNGPFSAAIHASSSGEVIAIEPRPIPHSSGLWGDCIVIRCDGEDRWVPLQETENPYALEADDLLHRIRLAGIAGMGGAGFPTAVKLRPPATSPIDTLIINGTECEPYITADDVLMQERSDDIIRGCALLAHILGEPDNILIGVEDNKPKAIAALEQSLKNLDASEVPGIDHIQVVSFPTKYPSGGEKQLIQILTGKEVPSGGLPAHIGIVLQNVGTTVAIWEAIKFGKPLTERITTVVGESLQQQGNTLVRIGTPSDFVLKQFGFSEQDCARLIAGGPMMGFSLPDINAPIVKTSNCLLAPSHQEMPDPEPAQACIRCGHCAEACPASLLPQQLYWYAQAKDHDRLQAHNLMDCIECGACAYVCPSSIPLVQYYRASKGEIRQAAIDKEKSDRSRQRFEFRQKRIEAAEAEKEAKRLARKKAAEAAKAAAKPAPGTAPSDPVAAAMARVQAQQDDPAEQLAKLERAFNNATNRAKSAEEKWQQAEADDQKAKLEARFKQAQVRMKDAEAKLTEFKQKQQSTSASVDSDDPIERAKAKAQQRLSMSPLEKARKNLETLQERLKKAEQKAAEADDDKRDALNAASDKLKQKIEAAEQELKDLQASTTVPEANAVDPDSIEDPIERAKAKAQQRLSMSPLEKARKNLEAMGERLKKAEQKAAEADEDKKAAMDSVVDKLKQKICDLEQEINELQAAAPAPAPAPAPEKQSAVDPDSIEDPIERAKAKAMQRLTMSPTEKLQSSLKSLEARLSKSEEKLAAATDDQRSALEAAVAKLQDKIATVKQEISEAESAENAGKENTPEPEVVSAVEDAAAAAIAKAKEKAAAQANMSPEEKQQAQIDSLKQRIDKAQLRLDNALAENSDNIDAFKLGLEKLQNKLAELEAE